MADYFEADAGRPTAAVLSDSIVAFVSDQLEALADRYAPGLVLPRVFAGHLVGPDTRSDLAYTLGLLFEAGRQELAGVALPDAVLTTLGALDGSRTDTFYSYRAAESLGRIGGYHENPRLRALNAAELANLREAFDSSASIEQVRSGQLPQNYAVVVARCEHARLRLGLLDDTSLFDELLERSRELIEQAEAGWIDDSNEKRGQFDIYTPDVFLFAEPLAERIGDAWTNGLRRVLADIGDLAIPGGAIVWGRSIGALGMAMTVELGALGTARGLVAEPGEWLARAVWAQDELRGWFKDGVIAAHQHRSTMFYRGPARRLQMSFDVLGKLVAAALELRRVPELRAAEGSQAWRPVDRFVCMGSEGRNAHSGAWVHRERKLSFVLPLVDGFSPDYLPSPRAPGVFEVPTGGPISGLPVVHHKGQAFVSAGSPLRVEHKGDGVLEVEHQGWSNVGADPAAAPIIAGGRTAHYRVEGRSLVVDEELSLDTDPGGIHAVSLQLHATAARPLTVEFDADVAHRVDRIDVAGLAENRSFWSELPTVHQLDLEPAPRIRLRWRATPVLRVSTTANLHDYNTSLYSPLAERVITRQAHPGLVNHPRALRDVDLFHMHWPEWWQGLDLDAHRHALERLREAGVPILWTMHNLLPHRVRDKDARVLYQLWADAADAVIHHTEFGRERALDAYRYRDDALHRVIPHGHWGARFAPHQATDRGRVEAELGLSPCAMRLGVIGAPRIEKDVQLVLDAFHACKRDDLQLLVVCIGDERVPDDPRILALPNRFESEFVYYQRLTAIDAIVFPFRDGMLMTGTVGDAIGAEKAALVSDWAVLDEVFGPAAIRYGSSVDDLRTCLESLTPAHLAESAKAMRALQPPNDWTGIAQQTHDLLEELATR